VNGPLMLACAKSSAPTSPSPTALHEQQQHHHHHYASLLNPGVDQQQQQQHRDPPRISDEVNHYQQLVRSTRRMMMMDRNGRLNGRRLLCSNASISRTSDASRSRSSSSKRRADGGTEQRLVASGAPGRTSLRAMCKNRSHDDLDVRLASHSSSSEALPRSDDETRQPSEDERRAERESTFHFK
jgi:hypothetical protein